MVHYKHNVIANKEIKKQVAENSGACFLFQERRKKMSRKARNKIRKDFACNKEGSEEFMNLIEEYSKEAEIFAAYEEFKKGRDFRKLDPEERMSAICTLLS